MARYVLMAAGIAILAAVVWLSLAAKAEAGVAIRTEAMSDDERIDGFWGIIEATRASGYDQDLQREALAAELSKLSPAEIEAFGAAFDELLAVTHSWDLWGAAYVVLGGASDDTFEYFRVWLISRGRDVFEAALANPDELVTLIPADYDEVPEFESLAYVASEVWAEKTGNDATDMLTQPNMIHANEPSGKPFEETSEDLRHRYPRLWSRFGESPLG